jgi:Kelch motif/Galactose oxidase, central domain
MGTVALACLLGAAPAFAATRYAAPNGSGTTCSQQSPCSLTEAAGNAATNDEVVVAAGDYSLASELMISASVNIHGAAGQARPRVVGAASPTMSCFSGSTVTLSHLRIEGDVPLEFGDCNLSLEDVLAIGGSAGASIGPGTHAVRDSVVTASGASGTALNLGGSDTFPGVATVTLRNVTVVASGATSTGIGVHASYGFGGPSDSATNVDAKNVIARGGLHDAAAHGYQFTGTGTLHFAYSNYRPGTNDVADGGSNFRPGVISDDGHNQTTTDPAFVNAAAGDYHQLASSPTVDAGTEDAQTGPSDIDGNPRELGLAPDIGADEFAASPTGLAVARSHAQAVLLHDGKVLVAAGSSGGTPARNAELFDPATGLWSPGGYMAKGRTFAAASVLESGKVLVSGGSDGTIQNTAELYDPANNTWSSGGSLFGGVARWHHTSTLLGNAKVLIVGGSTTGTNGIATAALYNPATNAWATAASLGTGRYDHTATLLADGRVLVAGGSDGANHPLKSAEVANPAATAWTSAGTMTTERTGHTATLLQNGKVLVAGGVDTGGAETATAELYDPASNTWSPTGNLAHARSSHTATLLRDGRVLVQGGFGPAPLASSEIYDPATNSWSAGPPLSTARAAHTATGLLDGRVLAAGGEGLSSSERSAAFSPNVTARRPIVGYVDPQGQFALYDSETGTDLPAPALPANLTRFAMSLGGQYIVYVDPANKTIHLFDRFTHAEVPLPGIDVDDDPANPTVSDAALIAFDHNSNGPARVYDAKSGHFVETGLVPFDIGVDPAFVAGHRQTHLSGNGRFLATTCQDHCVSDSGGEPDLYLQDLTTMQKFDMPNDQPVAQDAEHPCINGNGTLVGTELTNFNPTSSAQRDVVLYDRASGGLLPAPNVPAVDDIKCVLDSGGQHIGIADQQDHLRLYDRLTGAFVALPSKVGSPAWFSDPIDLTPPETAIQGGPSGIVSSTDASFTLVSSEANSTFECRLDSVAFAPCASPKSYAGLVNGPHTFEVRATDEFGNTDPTPATRTWTVGASTTGPGNPIAEVTSLKLSPTAFFAATRGASIARKRRTGTKVTYVLTATTRVRFTVSRQATGRRSGKRCVKPSHANRRKHKCVRLIAMKGSFSVAGKAGKQTFHFSGRLRGKALPPASYVLFAKPGSRRATFRIICQCAAARRVVAP